jgi:superfamily II DNA or RNA helicase
MSNEICVTGGGKFLPPGHPKIDEILRKLRLPNPEYGAAMGMRKNGKYVPVPDQYVNGAREIPSDHQWRGGLMVPRKAVLGLDLGKEVDKRTCPEAERITTAKGFRMREYQKSALSQWLYKYDGEGVVVAPCGSGKTAMGLSAACLVDTKALILVHTNDLAAQWVNRAMGMLNVAATQYGGGKKDASGRIVVATFQTLERMSFTDRYEFGKQFGLVITDESHHVPSRTFSMVMFAMPAKYRLGLTATPERPDGLTEMMWWHIGECVYEITNQQLSESGHVVMPKIEWFFTQWPGLPSKVDWSKLITAMTKDEDRNEQIINRVLKACHNGRQVLVLSDRVDHCSELAEAISRHGIEASPLVGKMTKKQRAEVLEKANQRKVQVVCATTVADEGLDLPSLDTVVLTTPTKALGRIQQRIGRIMRPHPEKQSPVVIDCIDDIGAMRGLARKRQRLYTQIGCV